MDFDKILKDINKEKNESMAVIRKDGSSSKPYCIYSKTGRKLGCYQTKKQAEERLAQIEKFKHMNK